MQETTQGLSKAVPIDIYKLLAKMKKPSRKTLKRIYEKR